MDKRILLIGSYLPSILNFRGDLIKRLIEDGFTVFVSAPDANLYMDELERIKSIGAVFHEIPMSRTGLNPINDIKTIFAIRKLIKILKITHLLVYTIKPVIYGLLATLFTDVQQKTALITGLGYAFGQGQGVKFKAISFLAHHLYRAALNQATAIVFQNPDDSALFVSRNLVLYERTAVVNGSGINTKDFSFQPAVIKSQTNFLFIARLIREKGIYDYIEAATKLRNKWPSAVFHVVGWIDDNPSAIKTDELNSWVEQGVIEFHGKLKSVKEILVKCDVFVLPSYYPEGTPRTILEALATGRAIVTTDMPGCRETVLDGENGFLIPPNSSVDLCKILERFLAEPNLISEMGIKSRKRAVDKYCVNKVNKRMIELINGV
ncbi:glycosyltransferase family 4 protein [Glaciecola sp. SC05]|uniref:glycosyltransferase family 4 protein n=1 Tax=Glaciecola sp. SC05 TaxID=1987355 RepID=UPI0035290AE5